MLMSADSGNLLYFQQIRLAERHYLPACLMSSEGRPGFRRREKMAQRLQEAAPTLTPATCATTLDKHLNIRESLQGRP